VDCIKRQWAPFNAARYVAQKLIAIVDQIAVGFNPGIQALLRENLVTAVVNVRVEANHSALAIDDFRIAFNTIAMRQFHCMVSHNGFSCSYQNQSALGALKGLSEQRN
jgi:hypothetical protein